MEFRHSVPFICLIGLALFGCNNPTLVQKRASYRGASSEIPKPVIPKPVVPAAPKASPTPRPLSAPTSAAVSDAMSKWASDMIKWGHTHCDYMKQRYAHLDFTYYDGERVYFQIADYVTDPAEKTYFNDCAQIAESRYRDDYVLANNGSATGYGLFPDGMQMDFLRTGDQVSKSTVGQLAMRAAFAYAPLEWTADQTASREVAYNLRTKIIARKLGVYDDDARTHDLFEQAIGHLNQWFVTKTATYVRPFMVGLTAEAVITYHDEVSPDPRIVDLLKLAADYLFQVTFDQKTGCTLYTDRDGVAEANGGTDPACPLNQLISAFYGWLHMKTGDSRYLEMGDSIFVGGATYMNAIGFPGNYPYASFAKEFNQNYRLSFNYLKWTGRIP